MTNDDIIRMAQEAGFSAYHLAVLDQGIYRFANLVAAAEREACARAVSDVLYGQDGCGKAIEAIRARGQV